MIQRGVMGEIGWASHMPNNNHCREEGDSNGGGEDHGNADERPKYVQVRDALVERIRSGKWKPGAAIPSELEIADEFKVAAGTARKAILLVTDMGLLTRRQGSGTWVHGDTPSQRYGFFSFFGEGDTRIRPGTLAPTSTLARASKTEQSVLKLRDDARVVRIARTRTRDGKPFITEKVSVPEALFPSLAHEHPLPDALYDHYQKAYQVLITRVEDHVTAMGADAVTAERLRVAVGTPLLKVDRIAYTPNERPVEWRVWLCQLRKAYYRARIGV